MERKEFIKNCNTIFNNWCAKDFQKDVEKILDSGAIDLDSVEPNYADCYPVVAAILYKTVDSCINGSVYPKKRRKANKKMHNYLCFI